jgi:lysyl-tRNA synthetase class 2
MKHIRITSELSGEIPEFCRAVIVARNVNNDGESRALQAALDEQVARVRGEPTLRDYPCHPRIAPWISAFTKAGMNPRQMPPSIVSLVKRVRSGGTIPFINKLVCLFNLTSLKHLVPSGGDDLRAVGDLCLGKANGNERYTPLGKPGVQEIPSPGEVIYYDRGTQQVLCRGWCWRNGHGTRIQPSTADMAINVDALAVNRSEALAIADELAADVATYCGGEQRVYLLSRESPEIEFDVEDR